jgi:hypothetical protein
MKGREQIFYASATKGYGAPPLIHHRSFPVALPVGLLAQMKL